MRSGRVGSGGRTGIHSQYARTAAALRSAHGPWRRGLCSAAPPDHAPPASSWSSQTATIGWRAWSAWRSGSAL